MGWKLTAGVKQGGQCRCQSRRRTPLLERYFKLIVKLALFEVLRLFSRRSEVLLLDTIRTKQERTAVGDGHETAAYSSLDRVAI